MASPSTPRSTRSASLGNDDTASASGNSPKILTPGRKIRAMLAAFDSDSDSDNGGSSNVQRPSIAKPTLLSPRRAPVAESRAAAISNEDDDDDDEEESIIVPRGRIAARMQAQQQEEREQPNGADKGETAYERVARRLHAKLQETKPPQTQQQESSEQSSEDELPATGFGRRLLKRRKPSDDDEKSDRSPSRERPVSPLFVSSPNRDIEEQTVHDENEDQPEPRLKSNARFLALLEQKRKEREERERIEAEKKAARAEQLKQFRSDVLSDEDSDDEPGSGRKLTQQSRPPRKASKKAIEEMNRETQRISRNMQLAHQAKTKKKITKESFLARFNFVQPQKPETTAANSSTTTSSAPSSDAEGQNEKTTPPTSPVREEHEKSHPVAQEQTEEAVDLPSVEEIMTQQAAPQEPVTVGRVEVSERTATPVPEPETSKPKPERKALTKPPVRVRISRQDVAQHQKEDSDSDLEVITSPAKCRRIAAFENLPARQAQEPASLLKLKALAHLTSPTRRSASMSPAELSASLRLQARQQAAKEREERIQELKAKGIIIETAEERAAMEDDVEDLMEKARKEAEEIAKREKAAREKKHNEDEDSEEDEDYELSGSDEDEDGGEADDDDEEEEEQVDEEDEEDEENEGAEENEDLVEQEAEEADESEDERTETMSLEAESEVLAPTGPRKRRMRVISDDEDDEQEAKTPAKSVAESTSTPKRPQFPDMSASDGITMGLTQAFAGTLGDDQPGDSQPDNGEDSLKLLRTLPDPGLPVAEVLEPDSQVIVKDSQEQRRESIDLLAGYTQSDTRVSESPAPNSWSQPSQIPDPTQDAGFVLSPFDQTKRFLDPPASTIETVLLPRNESPTKEKRGRLLRRGRPDQPSDVEDDFEIKASAFDVMRKAAKKKTAVPFDKYKSKAKEHIDEIAEESEDEYAGLGGASDDSSGEEDEYDREMINDGNEEVVDEKELAALNADHQRAMDEKQVNKLLKDITSGALRRRRGVDDDLDLDDSDDERMARRREKRQEFARMRKALLADEKIGEIASNPKTQAFFKAIEDRDSEDDMDLDFLDEGPSSQDQSSQNIQQQPSVNEATVSGSKKRKRPLEPSAADIANRPPPHLRRTAASAVSKKPTTLAEIRESVSFLIEQPEYDSFHEDASIEEEEEPGNLDNSDKPSHEDENANVERRTSTDGFTIPPNPRRTRGRVVDRLALLRAASSNSASSNGRAAFESTSTTDGIPKIGFRPPVLHRTITGSSSSSYSSVSSGSGSTTRTTTGPPPGTSNAKKGAVNYYTAARERERERELRAKQRGGGSNIAALLSKQKAAGLGALMGQGQWE